MTIVLVLLLLLFENVPEFFFPKLGGCFSVYILSQLVIFSHMKLIPICETVGKPTLLSHTDLSVNEDAVRLIVNSYCNHKQIQIVALCEFLVLILRSAQNVPIIVDSMWCKQSMCCTVHFPPDARKWLWEHHEFSVQCTLHIAQHAYW